MPRDIKEKVEFKEFALGAGHVLRGGGAGLVQDRHDDLVQTDRWFVELQLRFSDEASAREMWQRLKHEFSAVRS